MNKRPWKFAENFCKQSIHIKNIILCKIILISNVYKEFISPKILDDGCGFWDDYELRKTRSFRGTRLDRFQTFCVLSFFSTLMPFLHESHCLLWPLTSAQREEHSENSVSSFHYLCPATSSSGYRAAGKDDRDSMEWNCLSLLSRLQLHRRRYNNPLPLCHRLNCHYYANESFMVLNGLTFSSFLSYNWMNMH